MAQQKGRKAASGGPGTMFWIALVALVVAGGGWLVLARGGDDGSAGERPQPVSATSVEADSAAGVGVGPEDAPAVVWEFVDYQCPHCAQFAGFTGQLLRQNLVQTDSLRWVLYDFPLGNFPNSVPAAMAARCADAQGRYWTMEELLFARQGEWGNARNPGGVLVDYAEELGLDGDAFRQCLEEQRYLETIMASRAFGDQLGVNSTPTIFFNGRRLPAHPDSLSYENIAGLVREAWRSADAGGG